MLVAGRLIGRDSSPGGRDLVLSTIRPGTLFGEMAVLDHEPRSLTVHAETDCLLLHMPTPEFRALLLAEPVIALDLATELARRTRVLNDQVFGLVMHDVETRLCGLLLRLGREAGQCRPGGVLQPAPTHEGRAGLPPESISTAHPAMRARRGPVRLPSQAAEITSRSTPRSLSFLASLWPERRGTAWNRFGCTGNSREWTRSSPVFPEKT
ncbi:Crp/Fnr family transcriptional regulator [Mangrovicoccus ximenensis]|uniref:Crp/Fnr family transcriptional regulator n=1 Tax=Mangrovicoccus ximenensis TaxID=1911570 RepID=UPI0038B2FAE2